MLWSNYAIVYCLRCQNYFQIEQFLNEAQERQQQLESLLDPIRARPTANGDGARRLNWRRRHRRRRQTEWTLPVHSRFQSQSEAARERMCIFQALAKNYVKIAIFIHFNDEKKNCQEFFVKWNSALESWRQNGRFCHVCNNSAFGADSAFWSR